MKKRLYIIAGITGAVGNALLSRLAREEDAIVYGISRRAKPFTAFLDPDRKKLVARTIICSVAGLEDAAIDHFVGSIDVQAFRSITYLHALGHFPFEVDQDGSHRVEYDANGDGINDLTYDLSYRVFRSFTTSLRTVGDGASIAGSAFIIGSIIDKYRPREHQSWWRTFDLVRTYMQGGASIGYGMHLVNVSSVICAHEVITRPYVFTATDADIRYWLAPEELANFIVTQDGLPDAHDGFREYDLFHKRPDVTHRYFDTKPFRKRKIGELYGGPR